jgi:guanylate kinase
MIEGGEFVEWAKVYDQFYGTSSADLKTQTEQGLDVLLDLDSRGASNTRKHFEDCVLIYLLPPSFAELEKRIRDRNTDDERIIRVRMQRAAEEIGKCVWYDYIVINADLEKALGEVRAIILAERCRARRKLEAVDSRFKIRTQQGVRHYGPRTES